MDNLGLYIDPVFIEEIMDFIKNIIYRMKIENYNVDKLFLIDDVIDKSKNLNLSFYQNKIKEYIQSYNQKGLIFHGDNFNLPELKLEFEISKIGLEHLLINKFGCSSFFIWTAKCLAEKKHSINLAPYTISSYIGEFKGILRLIFQRYKGSIYSEFISIGIKSVIGNITKIFDKKGGNVFKLINKDINNILN